jgi:nicotinamide mononucleotide transporter
VLATYLQAQRAIESWYVWILVDLVSIPVYFHRGLPFFAILYIIFLIICFFGLAHWRRDHARQSHTLAPARA